MTAPTSDPTGGNDVDATGSVSNATVPSASVPSDSVSAPPAETTPTTIGAIEADAVTAVQTGLATAHAAVWAYGVVSAYATLPDGTPDTATAELVASSRLANEQIRDSAADLLASVGQQPIRTEVAYQLPLDVVDVATARQVAVLIEKDATNAWRAVVGATDNYALRRFALTALSAAAVRLTTWRILSGAGSTVPFPGAEV